MSIGCRCGNCGGGLFLRYDIGEYFPLLIEDIYGKLLLAMEIFLWVYPLRC
jgi:hypothetical protein